MKDLFITLCVSVGTDQLLHLIWGRFSGFLKLGSWILSDFHYVTLYLAAYVSLQIGRRYRS